jgi:hypothetical protein
MRVLVSKVELAHILMERMRQFPEGKGVVITPLHILRRRVPRKDGGNWLPRQLTEDRTWLALLQVFSKAQDEFNLAEDSSQPRLPQAEEPSGPMVLLLYVDRKKPRGAESPSIPEATTDEGDQGKAG